MSLVTSELQGAVSLTRMQPVASLFAKFPRLVRDLAGELGKEVQLKLEGGEVELDKTILEGLSDPLTHMVRNSVDHGIESPAARVAAKKPAMGTVMLAARHQAGQVVIEISDDGKGLAGEKIGGLRGGQRHDHRRAAPEDVGIRKAGADFHAGRLDGREAQQRVRPRRRNGRGEDQPGPAGRKGRDRFGAREEVRHSASSCRSRWPSFHRCWYRIPANVSPFRKSAWAS